MTIKDLWQSRDKIQTSIKRYFCPRLDCREQRTEPLSAQSQSGPLRICRIEGDRRLCAKMAAMGLYPGREAELIHPECGGQCLLKIEDCTLCLDKSISECILVTNATDAR